MSKTSNSKLKLLYLAKIFFEETDEEHALNNKEIISRLAAHQVSVDRKTLYSDIEELKQYGLDITNFKKGRSMYYQLSSREFELAELKLLVDSVQSAKFITEKKSLKLIEKLEGLASHHQKKDLQRQVTLLGRLKNTDEKIFYAVDNLYAAINQDRQVQFKYFQWNVQKERVLRHDGAWYQISPWALIWDDEYYYLLGYDVEAGRIKHYRVDKMLQLDILEEKRLGEKTFNDINLPQYSKKLFGMYNSANVSVTLLCENDLAGPIIDRFGENVMLTKVDDEHFRTTIEVSASDLFIGWIIGLGKGAKIIAPENMVTRMQNMARRLAEQYLG